MALAVFVLALVALTLLYYYATKHFTFWKNAGVKCLTDTSLLGVFKDTFFNIEHKFYRVAPSEPYIGLVRFSSLTVSIRDPELIRLVLVKDFAHFHDRGLPMNEKRNPLSIHLVNLEGRKWRILRSKLTPTFTSGKLRGMYPLVKHCADQMIDVVTAFADKPQAVDLNGILSRYTTDVILSCAFGLQGNSLNDPEDIYRKMVKLHFKFGTLRKLEHIFFRMFPALQNIIPPAPSRKAVSDFFINSFSSTVKQREQSGIKRNDFLDLLIEIKQKGRLSDGHVEDDTSDSALEFTDNLMASQAFVFFIAGSETSSTTASFAIVEIANNIPIQDKLRAEIDEVTKRHGGLTYEAILDMTYLDQVVSETLRKYPPVKTLAREVSRPYPMPDGKVTLPVGTRAIIHVVDLHMDPKYYPEPEKFDPERFAPEAKSSINKYAYLPFGEGPRVCIGMRFGLLQTKLALAALIAQFEFRPEPGIPYPPVVSDKNLTQSLEYGAGVLITRRKSNTL